MAAGHSGSIQAGFHTVTDPRQAALLTDPAARRFYEPFLARARSAKEAADEAGCALDTMLYRVRVFLKAGLLARAGERRRPGRAVKLYRTAYDAYFIPHAVTPFATLEERLYTTLEPTTRRLAGLLARRQQRRGQDGQRLYRDEFGQPWMEGAPDATSANDLADPDRPPGLDFTTTVYLNEREARAVQALLVRLLEEQRPNAQPGRGQPFLLGVFFTSETP